MFILFLIVQKEKRKCLKHKFFFLIILEIIVHTWYRFFSRLCGDDHDFEALKVTEVPSELRI